MRSSEDDNTASVRGTKALSTNEDDNAASVSRASCSTAEITATAIEAAYTSNEDSMSHASRNYMDKDFKAWEEDEQNFDKESKILLTAYKLFK